MAKTKAQATERYIDLFATRWQDHLCIGCGQDPRHVYDREGRYIVALDENRAIERKRQLCWECAWDRAQWEKRP